MPSSVMDRSCTSPAGAVRPVPDGGVVNIRAVRSAMVPD